MRDLVALEGGRFLMGTEDPDGFPADGEGPVRQEVVGAFRIAPTTVTNAQWQTRPRTGRSTSPWTSPAGISRAAG